jgi:hypothetical protein
MEGGVESPPLPRERQRQGRRRSVSDQSMFEAAKLATQLVGQPAQAEEWGEEAETMSELLADCRLQQYGKALQDEGYVLALDLSEAGEEELEGLVRRLGLKMPEARRLRAALSGRRLPEATPPAVATATVAAAAAPATTGTPRAVRASDPDGGADAGSPGGGSRARLSMQEVLVEIRTEIGIEDGEELSAQGVSDRAWTYLGLRTGNRDPGMLLKEDIGRLCLQLGIATGWTIEGSGDGAASVQSGVGAAGGLGSPLPHGARGGEHWKLVLSKHTSHEARHTQLQEELDRCAAVSVCCDADVLTGIFLRHACFVTKLRSATDRARWEPGRWVLGRELGQGSFGRVMLVEDRKLGQVALKFVGDGDVQTHRRLCREVSLMKRVQHQHVCAIFDHFSCGGLFCMALEHLEMGSLEQVVEASAGQRMSQAQATTMAFHVLRALTKMHAMDVIHRDLKPRNIMYSSQGGFKLIDLGIAAISAGARDNVSETLGTDTTGLAALVGTPHWMSPEQWSVCTASASAPAWPVRHP